MNIDIDRIEVLLEQVDKWLRDGAREVSIPIGLKWTGEPDAFEVTYDRDKIGLLVIAIASNPVLAATAWAALLKVMSEYGDLRRLSSLQEFVTALERIHEKMDKDGLCDTEYPLVFARNGRSS